MESVLSIDVEGMIPLGHSNEQREGVQTAQGSIRRHPAMRGVDSDDRIHAGISEGPSGSGIGADHVHFVRPSIS